ncbi:hypothetical protein [Streptomyces sp. 7N604]|uniref:hypothetical protein n=1 Tax=Streptomyces sp. 7N604 TaxID=3457415 RepID=UPI003FD29A10
MATALTIAALLALIAGAAHVIQRLNAQHAGRIALFLYHGRLPGREDPAHEDPGREGPGHEPGQPLPKPTAQPELRPRRDNRDGGRGRLRPRRRSIRARG